jgi:CoA binding protein
MRHLTRQDVKIQRLLVVPIRRERAEVPGQIDLTVIFGPPRDVPETISAAARRRVEAVWLMPGVPVDEAKEEARRQGIPPVTGRDIVDDHRDLTSVVEPRKLGVHLRPAQGVLRGQPQEPANRRRPRGRRWRAWRWRRRPGDA